MIANESYKLGGGKLYFAEKADDGSHGNFEYWGRTAQDLKINIEIDTLEHTNSEGSSTEIDFEIETKKNISMALVTDDMTTKMVARFFRAVVETTAQTSGVLTAEAITVSPNGIFELGTVGFAAVSLVQDATDTTTYAEGVDFSVDLGAGTIEILATGSIGVDEIIHVTATYDAVTFDTVHVGTQTKLEGKFKFISEQATGLRIKALIHKVSILPSGEFALKGTEDWTSCSFDIKILKDDSITAAGESKYMKIEEIPA